jgi:hypothetical protein
VDEFSTTYKKPWKLKNNHGGNLDKPKVKFTNEPVKIIMMENQILEAFIKKWGIPAQTNQAIEECAEFIVAVNKVRRSGFKEKEIDDLCSEIADVTIMMAQMRLVYGAERVDEWIKIKLERGKSKL